MVGRLGVVLAVLMTTAAGAAAATSTQPYIPTLEAGDTIPPIPLVAQDNRSFTFSDFRSQAVIVGFIYTRCQDARMCPLVMAKFSGIQRAIGRARVKLVTLTLDPTYDTPAVLRRYGRSFGQDGRFWTLGTGSKATIDGLAGRFGIAATSAGPRSIIHTEAAVVIDPAGRIAQTVYGNDWSPADMLAAARATLPGKADRLAMVRAWFATTLERCGGGVAVGTTAILGVFGVVLAAVGGAFWQAFRKPARPTKG